MQVLFKIWIIILVMVVSSFKFWLTNARYHALGQSFYPCLVAVFLSLNQNNFSLIYALLAIFGVIFAHLGINLLDDFFDYSMNKDLIMQNIQNKGKSARFGKCHYLFEGKTTTKQLLIVALTFCAIAAGFGFIIFLKRGVWIIVITVIAALLGYFYSAKPLKLSYNYLGEIVVGIMFGPLLMCGVFYSACGTLNLKIALISLIIGLWVTNILYVHSVLDYESDKTLEKKTLAVLFGKKYYLIPLVFFTLAPYFLVSCGMAQNILEISYFWIFLTIFNSILLLYLMFCFVKLNNKKFEPKWYMGIMENWDKITKMDNGWFMIRWYCSRNLLIFGCIMIIVAEALKHV